MKFRRRTSLPILIGIAVVGVVAMGAWYWNSLSYSKDIMRLEILAPDSVVAGEEVEYLVRYKNNGNIRLENVSLAFEYPTGAIPSDGGALRRTQQLDDMYPGQEETSSFKGRLFAKEGVALNATAEMSYSPKNLQATYRSDTSKAISISALPITFELDTPSRVDEAQDITLILNYFSASPYPFSSLRVKMEYPDGFNIKTVIPAPLGNNEWNIGVLNKGEGGKIVIVGRLEGGVSSVKFFHATLGSWKDGEYTLLREAIRGVEIGQPKLIVKQTVNGLEDYTASPGELLHYEISFQNVSDAPMENLLLVSQLDGRAYDVNSVSVDRGSFRASDGSVVWEAKQVPALRFLGKGEQGKAEFWVKAKDEWEVFSPQDKNFVLKNMVLLGENREEFKVNMNGVLGVDQKAFYNDDVFGNSGPSSPVVGATTTYTITWLVSGSYNDFTDVEVRAKLSQGVTLTRKRFPEEASLVVDGVTREIVWEVGSVGAGSGKLLPPPSVSFQVQLTPTFAQKGTAPLLMDMVSVTGKDAFTNNDAKGMDVALTTAIPDDTFPAINGGIVQ